MTSNAPITALVDGRVIDHPTAGARGVGRYTIGFVRAMRAAGVVTTVLCSTRKQRRRWQEVIPGISTEQFTRDVVVAASGDSPWFICTQLMLHPIPLDVVPRVVTELDIKVAAIIHDVIPQRFPERYLANDHARIQTRLRTVTCRSIDRFCANSTFTADTSAVELGVDRSRIDVVGAVVEPQFVKLDHKHLLKHIVSGQRPTVVAVTGADSRKNTERLIAAWAQLSHAVRSSHELVVACAAPQTTLDHWNHLAVFQGAGGDIRFTGEVSDDELVSLMQQSVLGVMPSLEEGFGLPIAEMVACGTPVLCSSTSSMPEVAGCEEALFDPYDVSDIAGLISRALTDESFRARVLADETKRLQRWSVEHVGGEILSALQKPTRPRRTPEQRPMSVAFVAPHPSSGSGIGPYTHMVLEHWPDSDEVIALDDCSVSAERLNSRASRRAAVGAGAVGRTIRAHDVDHLVIALGSSEHHAVSLERAATGGAHLWLHEATALGAVIGPAHFGGGERWTKSRLDELGVERIAGVDVMDPVTMHDRGVTVLNQAVSEARSIIVTSDEARDALMYQFGEELPPTVVIPLAHPVRDPSTVGGHRVVSFGVVDDNKRPDALLDLLVRCEDIHLDIIGPITNERRAEIERNADRRQVLDRLTLHGRVDDDALDELFSDVRCAVQLRSGHPGQMSAAICELLSRGIPVITNMTTHGEGHDGLFVIDGEVESVAQIVDLLQDQQQVESAGASARSHAQQWTADHVVTALRSWLRSQAVERAEPQ